jgi:hypothetical protein
VVETGVHDVKVQKPLEQQVILQLLTVLPLAAHRTGPSTLLFIKMLLAQQPYAGRWQPGTPYDSRAIALARVFEIGYYVVEDDQTVYLASVRFIGGN